MADVRVLIVDDHEPFRTAIAGLVGVAGGFQVVGLAATGEESVAIASELRPDLVLMDLRLPGIDGMEAARRLQALPAAPLVIIVSTTRHAELVSDLADCGAVGFLHKGDLDLDRLTELRRRAEQHRRRDS